jgi:hypothetical protein
VVPGPDPAARLADEVRTLAERLRRLPVSAWPADPVRVQATAQRLADESARLEGEPRRQLPPPDSPPQLADQLAVVVDDLVRAGREAGPAGAAALEAARRDLAPAAGKSP